MIKGMQKIFFIILPTLIIVFPLATLKNVYVNFIFVSLLNFVTVLSIFHDLKIMVNKVKRIQKRNDIKFLLYTIIIAAGVLAYLVVFLWLAWCFIGALYIKGVIFINTKISI